MGTAENDYIFRKQQQQLDAELEEMGSDVTDPSSIPINTWRTRQDMLLTALLAARIVGQQDTLLQQVRAIKLIITAGLALIIVTMIALHLFSPR